MNQNQKAAATDIWANPCAANETYFTKSTAQTHCRKCAKFAKKIGQACPYRSRGVRHFREVDDEEGER